MLLFIVLIMVSHILGITRVPGKIIIPTADGTKTYQCVIIIAQSVIMIDCDKKIFQPLNSFETPKKTWIKLNMADIELIQIQYKSNSIYFVMKTYFFMQYRNYFNRAYIIYNFFNSKETWAMICDINKSADTVAIGKELKKIIGDRCEIIN